MRSCIHLLCLAAVFAYSADLRAHNDRGSVVEGVRWHGHKTARNVNRVLHEAFGSRRSIWGIRDTHIDLYDANRTRLTASGYDDVLVTYTVSGDRRRRDDRRRRGTTIAVGIAQFFSKYRRHEIAIEHFDRSRSRVIEVRDIRGVLLTHARGYGNVTFDERALKLLGIKWQRRFPTDRGQRYRFRGRVVAIFSDANHLIAVRSVRRGRGDTVRLNDRPVALVHGDQLERQRRDRDRRERNPGATNGPD